MKGFQPQQLIQKTQIQTQTQSKIKPIFLELGELFEEGGEKEIERNNSSKTKNS